MHTIHATSERAQYASGKGNKEDDKCHVTAGRDPLEPLALVHDLDHQEQGKASAHAKVKRKCSCVPNAMARAEAYT